MHTPTAKNHLYRNILRRYFLLARRLCFHLSFYLFMSVRLCIFAFQHNNIRRDVAKHWSVCVCVLPEIWTSMLKNYLKCNTYNRAFFSDFHCHTKLSKKRGSAWSPLPENVYIFKNPGLHFWRCLKQIRKRIGSKLTVFYKNGYHFTKITTILRKFYPKMTKF
jgi:hypothetical protein